MNKRITLSEVLGFLMDEYTREEILDMSSEELDRAVSELEDEISCARQDEAMDEMIHGNAAHEQYLMSDEYEADCKQEQFDWIKNA